MPRRSDPDQEQPPQRRRLPTEAEASLGATPYRGPPRPAAADRDAYRATTRWRHYERILAEQAAACGVEVLAREPAEGLWEGTAEPAEAVRVRGSPTGIGRLAARVARAFNQDAVMVVTADRAGPGRLYRFGAHVDADRALELLRVAGVPGGRVVAGRLELADADDSLGRELAVLARQLGPPIAVRARIEFVGQADYPDEPG